MTTIDTGATQCDGTEKDSQLFHLLYVILQSELRSIKVDFADKPVFSQFSHLGYCVYFTEGSLFASMRETSVASLDKQSHY